MAAIGRVGVVNGAVVLIGAFVAGNDRSLIYPEIQTVLKAAAVGGSLYVAGFGADDILGIACWFGPGQELFGT